jgi:hypothetical protein
MEPAERAFFLLAGHMQNEINSLNKVFTWCLRNSSVTDVSALEGLADGTQAMIYARTLAGKLNEAWEALGKSFFGTALSRRVEGTLHPAAGDALRRLKAYFSRPNLIFRTRNSFAFHYSAAEFAKHWEDVADEPSFQTLLGGTVGNNLHLASELVANAALLNSINPAEKGAALGRFFDEIQGIAATFTDFLEGAILVVLERDFPAELRGAPEESVSPARSISEVGIPFFCKEEEGK